MVSSGKGIRIEKPVAEDVDIPSLGGVRFAQMTFFDTVLLFLTYVLASGAFFIVYFVN